MIKYTKLEEFDTMIDALNPPWIYPNEKKYVYGLKKCDKKWCKVTYDFNLGMWVNNKRDPVLIVGWRL